MINNNNIKVDKENETPVTEKQEKEKTLDFCITIYYNLCITKRKGMISCHPERADRPTIRKSMKQEYECLMKILKFLNIAVKLPEEVGQILSERA